jgi:subtilisin family serine protease
MVSATNNATAPPADDVPDHLRPPAETQGRLDQLAYYSNYGSRVDLAAPGGARKFNLPRADGGPGNVLYGGWGVLGALVADGQACQESGGPEDFACFEIEGETFGWFQGSSMSSPNAAGVAALALAARPDLRGQPDALAGHLAATARTDLDNATPRLDPHDGSPDYGGEPCETGYCHLDWDAPPVGFAEAYGAGMVDATAAVAGGWW